LTNGFPGEFLMLKAVFNTGTGYCGVLAALTIIFCAVYMLRFFQLAFLGTEKSALSPLEWNEKLALVLIAAAVLYTGVQPQIILDMVQSNTDSWLNAIAESGGILS
jgi:NADH-quinone oxidoreductase subunit M